MKDRFRRVRQQCSFARAEAMADRVAAVSCSNNTMKQGIRGRAAL